jgi:3-phenylpropionate/trans-cinnamate dioxygenase ferredoxin reductase subunit
LRRSFDVVIVGAGHGGAQTALSLRQNGFEGTIALIGDEHELPYERPPLSKDYLAGEKPFERLQIRTAEGWAARSVTLEAGCRVIGVDPARRLVSGADGRIFGYERVVWAAGGRARALSCPGADAAGVHTIRNRADVDAISAGLADTREVVVVGGGFIGLEAAAVLVKLGKRVTVLEAADRVLARVAGEPLSRFYEAEHRRHGVDLRLGATVAGIGRSEGRAAGVRLADGTLLPAQMIIAGIGITPAVQPLLAAGATGGNGVRVDGQCRTSLPDIYAVGDCAEHRNPFADGDWVRLESVQNAVDQAGIAARSICGKPAAAASLPWFWSSQYDLRLQTIGLSRGFDDIVVRGTPASRRFSVVYLRRGRIVALDCVNAGSDFALGKALIANPHTPDRAALADPLVPLKTLVAATQPA